MRKTLDMKWLKKNEACGDGLKWYKKHGKRSVKATMLELVKQNRFSDLKWLIEKALQTKKESVTLAIFAANRCINKFEKECPDDDRPRKAIEAAQAWLDDPTEENVIAALSAARSADRSAWSATESADRSADRSVRSARSAAESARSAARSAARSVRSAAWSVRSAEYAAEYKKIIEFMFK